MKLQRVSFLVGLVLVMIPLAANAQWIPDGVGICIQPHEQTFPRIISDNAGGAIIAWGDTRGADSVDVYIQRVNAAGLPQWSANGVALSIAPHHQQAVILVPDGAGGAIAFWHDYRNAAVLGVDIYARRINAAGTPLWVNDGTPICSFAGDQMYMTAFSDGAGGAIVTWHDRRNDGHIDIYAQRVNGSGVVQWQANGVLIANDMIFPRIVSDGAGGVIFAWQSFGDIYAQRVNSAGVHQWIDGGVAVCDFDSIQQDPRLLPDGAGGVFVSWVDTRAHDYDIYAQRLNSAGVRQWATDGVAVCTAPNQQVIPNMVESEAGVIVLWDDMRSDEWDLYAQRLNHQGAPMWITNGRQFCGAPGEQRIPSAVPDGTGGFIATWFDFRDQVSNIYAERVTGGGVVAWAWGTHGVRLCGANRSQFNQLIASDGAGGAIVAWQDERLLGDTDIYAQRVLSSGTLPFTTPVGGRTPSIRASEIYPNPVAGTAWLDVELSSTVAVQVDVFDAAGRLVRAGAGRRDGLSRIMIDARDNAGRLLPSGVYFCRISAAGETITRKLVIAR